MTFWISSEVNNDFFRIYRSTDNITYTSIQSFSGVVTPHTDVSEPASYSSTIAVGASTDWDYRAPYSQYSTSLDIVAPSNGGLAGITTTDISGSAGYDSGNYTSTFGGTSSAAPLAAGIGALLLARNPNLTAAQLQTALQDSAVEIGGVTYTNGKSDFYGHGRVNADAALDLVTADTTGPVIAQGGYALTVDTGISNDDQVTQTVIPFDPDDPQITIEFDERTAWAAEDVTVTAPDSSTLEDVRALGAGTKTLRFFLPTLTQDGEYTITLGSNPIPTPQNPPQFRDQTGNALNGGVDVTRTFILDTTNPTDIGLSSASVDENSTPGTVVGSLTWTDPGGLGSPTYSLTDDADGRFQISGNSLQVSGSPGLDFEMAPSHTVTVRVSDEAGNTYDEQFTINVNDVVESEPLVITSGDWPAENSITLIRVGTYLHAYETGTTNDVVTALPFANVPAITVTGTSAADTLIIDDTGGSVVPASGMTFDASGQTSGNDLLSLINGGFTAVTHQFTSTTGGTVNQDGEVLTYSNVEVVSDLIPVTNRTFTYGAAADSVTIADNGTGSDDVSQVTSSTGVPVEFDSPTGTLTVNAGSGNDSVTVSSIDALFSGASLAINGETGTDTLTAALFSLPVTINGGSDNDTLTGGSGNDIIDGGSGKDSILGGAGNDNIRGRAQNDTIRGGDGHDTVEGDGGHDRVYGDNGIDSVVGGNHNDTLYGGAGDDIINSGDGLDVSYGDGGNDSLTGHVNSDDTIHGGAGNDTVYSLGGDDYVYGDEDDDFVFAAAGNDFVRGGSGNDTLKGDIHNDTLWGDDGDDSLQGLRDSDELHGGPGNDTLAGGNTGAGSIDTIYGDEGDDDLLGNGDAVDIMYGGDGNNTLNGMGGNDLLDGEGGDDYILGGAGADNLIGGSGNDTIGGSWGNDILDGGPGHDSLVGSHNNDTLIGGSGNDILKGDNGTDRFTADDGEIDTLESGFGEDSLSTWDAIDILN